MDQVELDAAYDNFLYAPLQAQITRREASKLGGAAARSLWSDRAGEARHPPHGAAQRTNMIDDAIEIAEKVEV
jgi:hypothetical protein